MWLMFVGRKKKKKKDSPDIVSAFILEGLKKKSNIEFHAHSFLGKNAILMS